MRDARRSRNPEGQEGVPTRLLLRTGGPRRNGIQKNNRDCCTLRYHIGGRKAALGALSSHPTTAKQPFLRIISKFGGLKRPETPAFSTAMTNEGKGTRFPRGNRTRTRGTQKQSIRQAGFCLLHKLAKSGGFMNNMKSQIFMAEVAAKVKTQERGDTPACITRSFDAQNVIGSVHRGGQDALLAIYESTTAPIKAPSPTVTRTPAP